MTDRKKIVLDDFYNNFCIEERQDMFGAKNLKEPYQPSVTILDIYEDYSDDYSFIFACSHDKLNKLLDFMAYKKHSNNHFNAEPSRELISLIDGIFELQRELNKVGIAVEIDKGYSNWMFDCLGFLKESGGSLIPEELNIPMVVKYDPIFTVINVADEKRLKNDKVVFASEYQRKQAEELGWTLSRIVICLFVSERELSNNPRESKKLRE